MLRTDVLRAAPAAAAIKKGAVFMALSIASVALFPGDASAQFFWFDSGPRYYYRRPPAPIYRAPAPRPIKRIEKRQERRPETASQEVKTETGGPPLYAIASIEDQHLSIYGADGLIERTNISSGTSEKPTPTGVFAIIQKERWHESNLYSGAPMPFMQRITWSGIAMHTGVLPGYPASHGCIRLNGSFAERWFGMTKLGLRVVITPSDITPEPITHPNLPAPRYWPASASMAQESPKAIRSAALGSNLSSDAKIELVSLQSEPALNPVTHALAERSAARAALKQAELDESSLGTEADKAKAAAKAVAGTLRSAEREAAVAEERAARISQSRSRPQPQRVSYSDDDAAKAAEALAIATARLKTAREADLAARAASASAGAASERASRTVEDLKDKITEMGRRQETLSILVSLKDQRVYVRQALRPVFDAPVEIASPGEAIGNHIFVATAPAAGEKQLRWIAVTMPVEMPKIKPRREPGSVAVAIPSESATGALSRIKFPGEVLDFLSERVWTGASLIISDRGVPDSGPGNDFTIETRH